MGIVQIHMLATMYIGNKQATLGIHSVQKGRVFPLDNIKTGIPNMNATLLCRD